MLLRHKCSFCCLDSTARTTGATGFVSTTRRELFFAKDRIFAELTLSGSELVPHDQVFNALKTQVETELVVYLEPIDVILERTQTWSVLSILIQVTSKI